MNTPNNQQELKPCPFCGGEAEIEQNARNGYKLKCKSCLIGYTQKTIKFSLDWLKGKMIEDWNKRTTPPQPMQGESAEDKSVRNFIGYKVEYDREGQYFWGCDEQGGRHMIAELRGWGAIQNCFKDRKGFVDTDSAAIFQDEIGNWIADAINAKLKPDEEYRSLPAPVSGEGLYVLEKPDTIDCSPQETVVVLSVSPNFCPKCSPNTWMNYRTVVVPSIEECSSCGFKHKNSVQPYQQPQEFDRERYRAIAESHCPEGIEGSYKLNWIEGAVNMAHYLIKQSPLPASEGKMFSREVWVERFIDKGELPEIGKFVTCIDAAGEHRVYRRTEHGWNMRDAAGANSPNDNLPIVSWLEKVFNH